MEGLRGLLAAGVLPEIVRRVFIERRSGVLHVAQGIDRADYEFSAGYLTHAATTLPGAHLGDLLVQIGLLTTRDRDACLEIAALSGERIGEVLLRHAILDRERLTEGLALQLREVLVRTIVWTGGVYTFTDFLAEAAERVSRSLEPRLDPREIIMDATWTLVGEPAIDEMLGALTRKVKMAADQRLPDLDFPLSPADAFLLSRVDGVLSAETLLKLAPAPPDEARASLAGLLSAGVVEYVNAPLPTSVTTQIGRLEIARLAGRIESADPFEVFGVAADVSDDELRATYLRLLRSCDPSTTTDAALKPILKRMSNQLVEAFKEADRRRGARRPAPVRTRTGRIVAPVRFSAAAPIASTTTAPPPSAFPKPKAPPHSPRAAAATAPSKAPVQEPKAIDPSQASEAAAAAFDEGRFHEALAILHDAIPRLDGRLRRQARVRKVRVLLAVDNGARLAEEELKIAIAEDPANAEAHVLLGGIYNDRGAIALATAEYRKALDLEPRNITARDALGQIEAAQPQADPAAPSSRKKLFGR